jgi:pyridoxine 5-phosphate synthase
MIAPLPIRLGINIDHVATLRNARGGSHPDPLRAAAIAIEAGADNITAHLREDRRHITDDDIARLAANLTVPLNMEMAATREMLAIALKTEPHAACLVPEKRTERTTEGGLDVDAQANLLASFVGKLGDAGIQVSLFIAPDLRQIEAAARIGAPAIEIHVGPWCEALAQGHAREADAEWRRIVAGANAAHELGLEVHAGHGLDYSTAATISGLPQIVELNIGHYLMGEAIFVGLGESVRRMRASMGGARAALRQSDTAAAMSGGA